METEDTNISVLLLMQRLQFMALFIAVYESFKDYVIDCPRNLLDGSLEISKDTNNYCELCNKEEERQKNEKEQAKKHIQSAEDQGLYISENDEVFVYANYEYKKITQDGYTKWLTPKYDVHITKRLLTINGIKLKKPDIVLNSLMFFGGDLISENDLIVFNEVRNRRNSFAHGMAELLLTNVFNHENRMLFNQLLELYIKVNNCWSVQFECSIADDVPENADYENIISLKMYNLLSAIDGMIGTNYVTTKEYTHFTGLYECLMIPIKGEDTNG